MSLSRKKVELLAAKLTDGTLTPAERQQLNRWLDSQMVTDHYEVETSFAANSEEIRQRMLTRILEQTESVGQPRKPHSRRMVWWSAAATVLVALATATWFILDTPKPVLPTEDVVNDILPGGNRAVLSLSNGRKLVLDERHEGIIVDDEDILYNGGGSLGVPPADTLVLTTPQGGTYGVTLSDGSKVWLNAGSTLTYPSRFNAEERIVSLEGEAYFEVRKSQHPAGGIPFKVLTKGQTIEVLGTAFNVSAYATDLETITTLVEGTVDVTNSESETINRITPGQQAITRGAKTDVHKVDTDQYTAWKSGYFIFDGLSPEAAFAQLGRWYDLDVIYRGSMPTVKFFGVIERSKPLGTILNILSKSGLTFEVRQADNRNQLIVFNE